MNLGAQRLRERAQLPYGDPLLTGTPGAAYGPLLYAAHVPLRVLLAPEPVNRVSPARPPLTEFTYYLPPALATPLCVVAFHLPAQLALLAGAIAIAAQLWKIRGTATYVAWFYPFLLLGLFASQAGQISEVERRRTCPSVIAAAPMRPVLRISCCALAIRTSSVSVHIGSSS